jgi:hypothetical protein
MKLKKWSIVKTADGLGLAVKPPKGGAHHYEVCVAERGFALEINIYVDGIFLPVASMRLPIVKGESK